MPKLNTYVEILEYYTGEPKEIFAIDLYKAIMQFKLAQVMNVRVDKLYVL